MLRAAHCGGTEWRSGLLLARSMDEAAFAVWLGAEVKLPSGYIYALPERVKEILKAATRRLQPRTWTCRTS